MAHTNQLAILLTGDRALRNVAKQYGIDVHGILWIVEQLLEHRRADRSELVATMERWRADAILFIPNDLIDALILRCCV